MGCCLPVATVQLVEIACWKRGPRFATLALVFVPPVRPHQLAAVTLTLLTCAGITAACSASESIHDPSDFDDVDTDGKADGSFSNFDRHRLVSDAAFFDLAAVTVADVQTFLEETPYDKRSFLADLRLPSGELVATRIVEAAQTRGLNPIVLLATMQKEAGLISRSVRPSDHRVNFAFGCGCSDGNSCSPAFRGLDKQLECAADQLAEYNADLVEKGSTISGWAVGMSKKSLEGTSVVPANRATAALYTYTPWVLRGTGGNWLFWNLWRRYATAFSYTEGLRLPFNEGFIGGNCTDDSDCTYSGGRCIFTEGNPGSGTCTSSCETTCPDRAGAFATTFCVGDGSEGFCLAQCDKELSDTGCALSQQCVTRARHGEPGTTRDVCEPVP